jgi:hypothetical protein
MTVEPWHRLSADEALAVQQTTAGGLAGEEAAHRLAEHGPNRLTPPQKRGPLLRFLLHFHNVLIYVLLGAIRNMLSLRDGRRQEIDATDLAPANSRLVHTPVCCWCGYANRVRMPCWKPSAGDRPLPTIR